MDFPGCFRCHDENHAVKDGKKIVRTALPATRLNKQGRQQ